MEGEKEIIIAIDGPAGAGKSSVASEVAQSLNYSHLDTGSMYRGATCYLLQEEIPLEKEQDILRALEEMKMELRDNRILIDGRDITPFIRSPEVEKHVSYVSSLAGVRRILIDKQQQIAGEGGVVLDGRDIGTRVCPQAELKVFLSAAPFIRAKRRFFQTGGSGDLAFIFEDLNRRDEYDRSREVGPLIPARDARFLDTSHLPRREVVAIIVRWAREVMGNQQV